MKLTYGDIPAYHSGLMNAGQLKLPRKVTIAVSRNLVKLEEEIKIINEQRKDIINKYAALEETGDPKIEKGQFVFDTLANRKKFEEEMDDLNRTEVDLDIMTIDGNELEKCDSDDRYDIPTPIQEAALCWMMK